jgi:hypothetical protein
VKGKPAVKTQIHGITSLGFVGIATLIAAVAMFQVSLLLGGAYLLICGIAPLVILYAFCAKCPCQAHCGHVLPGRAVKIFKQRPAGPYTAGEVTMTGMTLLLLVGLPQFWLWRSPWLLAAFWGLHAVAAVQIRTVVCRACDNVYCPAKSR